MAKPLCIKFDDTGMQRREDLKTHANSASLRKYSDGELNEVIRQRQMFEQQVMHLRDVINGFLYDTDNYVEIRIMRRCVDEKKGKGEEMRQGRDKAAPK